MSRPLPSLSVVVPVHDGGEVLAGSLEALAASDLPRSQWELIVVDDASSDESALIAARYADAVVCLPGARRGPAYARNRGAELARGDCIAFLSADVRVRPDSLRLLAAALADRPDIAAVSAVCAPRRSASLATRYRVGSARYAGERSAEDAITFSPGCGVIRRAAFVHAGMWDEWRIHRPRTEAAEIGSRLCALGHRLAIARAVEVEHVREWNAVTVLADDLRDPGLHLFAAPSAPAALGARARLRTRIDMAAVLLLFVAIGTATAAMVVGDARLLWAAGVAIALTLAFDAALYAVLCRRLGPGSTVSVIPLHLASSLAGGTAALFAWARHHLVGDPRPHPAVEAFAEVGVETWPPVPRRRLPEAERAR